MVFASEFLRNIQTGYDTGLWAVSVLDPQTSAMRWTKAQKLFPFSRGVIYSSTDRTFTMPFVTQSFPEDRIDETTWGAPWEFPFRIQPLGSPRRLLSLDVAKRVWPILRRRNNPTHCITGMNGWTVFVPNEIDDAQWQLILNDLGEVPDTFPPPEDPIQRLIDLL